MILVRFGGECDSYVHTLGCLRVRNWLAVADLGEGLAPPPPPITWGEKRRNERRMKSGLAKTVLS